MIDLHVQMLPRQRFRPFIPNTLDKELRQWCNNNCKENSWAYKSAVVYRVFSFNNHEDATMFIMKFSSLLDIYEF